MTLYAELEKTPEGRKIAAILKKNAGTRPELMGKFLPGLKKVGKYTSKFTGKIAKVAAGFIGIPPSLIDSLAKIDPLTKKNLDAALTKSKAGAQAAALLKNAKDNKNATIETPSIKIKPLYIAAGAAGLVTIIFIVSRKGKK